jgi:hypothetical protein
MRTELKRTIVVLSIVLLSIVQMYAQYSSDHYHPKEIIRSEHIDSCLIYKYQDDSVSVIEKYVYDTLGNEIEVIYNENKNRTIMHYNACNLIVSIYLIPFNEPYFQRDTFIYNLNYQLKTNLVIENTGKIAYKKTFAYEDSKLSEAEVSYGDSKLNYTYVYKSDKLFRIKKTYNGVEDGYEELSYDDSGNLKMYTVINRNGDTSVSHLYMYNAMNLLSDWKVYGKSGNFSQYYRYLYDEKGLMILAETYTGIKNDDLTTASYHQDTYSYFRH